MNRWSEYPRSIFPFLFHPKTALGRKQHYAEILLKCSIRRLTVFTTKERYRDNR